MVEEVAKVIKETNKKSIGATDDETAASQHEKLDLVAGDEETQTEIESNLNNAPNNTNANNTARRSSDKDESGAANEKKDRPSKRRSTS